MKREIQSFIAGVADIVYSPHVSVKKSRSNFEKNDLKALQSDWEKVGEDLRKAMKKYEKERI